jgi:hypothetical protein
LTTAIQDLAPPAGSFASHLSALAGAMADEAQLISDLRETLLRQREGVALSDVDAIEGSIHALGRTLFTLDEARRRRTAITAALTGQDGLSCHELESSLGHPLPEPVAAARLAIQRAALQATEDVAVNQQVLKRALEAGETFLQQLFATAGDPLPTYQAGEARQDAVPMTGVLINRTA